MRLRTLLLLSVALSAMLGASAAVLPGWPQTRTLPAGGHAAINVVVTRPCTATVTLAWKNGPLTATLVTPAKTTVPVPLRISPLRVPITVTADMLRQGPAWALLLAVPATARLAAPVEVTATFEGPDADATAVQAFLTRAAATRLPAGETAARRFAARVQTAITARAQAAETQKTTYSRLLGTRLLTATQRPVLPAGTSLAGLLPGVAGLDAVRFDTIVNALPPKLVAVTPARGIPGDVVTLKATDLVPAERWSPEYVTAQTEVWFTINPNLTAPGGVAGVSKDAAGATLLQVRVPAAAATVVNPYDGAVIVKSTPLNYATNTLPFRWEPTPKPAVSTVTPGQAAAGAWITLKGQRFTPADAVFFVNESGAETPAAELRYGSAESLDAKVPAVPTAANAAPAAPGTLPAVRFVQVYVRSSVNNAVVKSNLANFQLLPPPTIGAFDRASGEVGWPLLITGVGFQSPVSVHFMQAAGGPDYVMRPAPGNSNAAQVIVNLPDIPLIPIGGVQVLVTVEAAGVRSAPKTFLMTPTMVEMKLPEVAWRNYKPQTNSDTSTVRDGVSWIAHYAENVFEFHSGTEFIAPTVTLQHGWKVIRIEADSGTEFVDGVNGDCYISCPPVTAADLTTKFDWWVFSQGGTYLHAAYIIYGPKGVPYK